MRTSNKILLTGFIVAVLIITGVYVTLYAKIKNGDLVVLRKAIPPPVLEKHATPNIKYVKVTGLEDCRVNYGDTARIELEKNWELHLKWRVNGDSLIVEGLGNQNYALGARVFSPVDLYLPADVTVHGIYSQLFVRGSDDSAHAFSRSVSGDHSKVYVIANSRGVMPVYWKKLAITSLQGNVTVSPVAEIAELALTLNNNSAFSDEGANFGNLSVSVDNTSSISLRHRSLEKIKIIKP